MPDSNEFEKLKAEVEVYQKQYEKLEKRFEDLEKEVISMNQTKKRTEYQFDQIMEAIKKLNDETIPNIVTQINELKQKPAKRWDTGVNALISAIIAGIVGFLVSKLGG